MSASIIVPGPALVIITSQASMSSGIFSTNPLASTCIPSGYDLRCTTEERLIYDISWSLQRALRDFCIPGTDAVEQLSISPADDHELAFLAHDLRWNENVRDAKVSMDTLALLSLIVSNIGGMVATLQRYPMLSHTQLTLVIASIVFSTGPIPSPPLASNTAGISLSIPSSFLSVDLGGYVLENIGRMGRPYNLSCSSCTSRENLAAWEKACKNTHPLHSSLNVAHLETHLNRLTLALFGCNKTSVDLMIIPRVVTPRKICHHCGKLDWLLHATSYSLSKYALGYDLHEQTARACQLRAQCMTRTMTKYMINLPA